MAMTAASTDFLNRLLRGEISSVETYDLALSKVGDEPGAAEILRIRGEHQNAVDLLTQHVTALGGAPSTGSGPWGTFASLVTSGAKLFGNVATLKALKEGEEHGFKEYERLLEDEGTEGAAKDLVRTEFLPRQREHIATLDRLMEVQNAK